MASPALYRRRDDRVSLGWSRWWRGALIIVGTYLALGAAALFASAFATIREVYRSGREISSPGFIALLTVGWLAGHAAAATTLARGAATALQAWGPIRDDTSRSRGRLSIVFLVESAVVAVAWLALNVVVTIAWLARAL